MFATMIIFLVCVATMASDIFNYEPFLHLMTGLESVEFRFRIGPQISIVEDVLYLYGGTKDSETWNDLWKMDLYGNRTLLHVGGVANIAATSVFAGDRTLPSLAKDSFPSPRRNSILAPRGSTLLFIGGFAGE